MAYSINRRSLLQWGSTFIIGLLLVTCRQESSRQPDRQSNNQGDQDNQDNQGNQRKPLNLTSPAFTAAAFIPAEFTCDGADQSPALSWDTPPDNTQSLTIILEDADAQGPDGGPFIHWVLYDLPPSLQQLPAALPTQPFLTSGGVQGKNNFDQYGYRGPCPPSGTHRYFFRLYAVDKVLDLPPGSTAAEVKTALEGHILAEAELMGRYSRQR